MKKQKVPTLKQLQKRHTKKKPVHLVSKVSTLTPCGKNISFHSIMWTQQKSVVTCKKCLKTHWMRAMK